jgi:hypothetical protein
MTAKDAKKTIIFIIENGEIVETNLFDHVMGSVDETTSPVGVMRRFHIRHRDNHHLSDRRGLLKTTINKEGKFEVWTWGVRGNNPRFIQEFETEDQAEDWLFQRTYEADFVQDDQRNTSYYHSQEDAAHALSEMQY